MKRLLILFCSLFSVLAANVITDIGQPQLAYELEKVTTEQREAFLAHLKEYGQGLLQDQREMLFNPSKKKLSPAPVSNYDHAGNLFDQAEGQKRIEQGKVGCIILAGGQGTRLGTDDPKGVFPVSLIKKKSLFQLFCERTLAASKRAGRSLHLAVMTSPLNQQPTEEFFSKNQWFGLGADQVDLFSQNMLPFLDEQGNWLLETPGKLAEGPDGNGGVLHVFYKSGVWKKWKELDIESVHVIVVDNPLADPFDPELCGYHTRKNAEVTMKCVLREKPEEKVGVLTLEGKKINVIEYFELTEEQRNARNADGSYVFKLANISLFCFDMEFIRKVGEDPEAKMPWHLQKKKGQVLGQKREVWKYEAFIFDLLAFADRYAVLCYPRDEVFSPLKNASGDGSVETVRSALLEYDREVYFRVTGVKSAEGKKFELDPAFYYPTPSLMQRWKGRALPDHSYITSED